MTDGAWLRFAATELHPERAHRLLEEHGGVVAALAEVDRSDDYPSPPALAECRRRLAESGARFEVAQGAGWVDRLWHVGDGPHWLYALGRLDPGPLVAIVGTRRCTEYGRRTATELADAAAAAGWGVVSGMARGIDSAAHRGAIDAGGTTVAVLGSGPDVVYPRENARLRQRILETGGAVVTEYPPGARPLKWRFPPRNRIISGLASAVVVVESRATGGSLSTAARAVAQGRVVFAVPGDIDRVASVGCNRLIRDGAIPVLGPDDLVDALSVVPVPPTTD